MHRVVFYALLLSSGKENTAEAQTRTDAGGRFQQDSVTWADDREWGQLPRAQASP